MPPTRTAHAGRGLAVALAVTLAGAFVVLAPAPASATRPFHVTESALALPPGGVRLEEGLSRSRWDSGHKIYALTTEVSYSLYANLDLEAEVPWVVGGGGGGGFDDGIGDVTTKAKINFVKERAAIPLTLSGLVGVKFPTGPNRISSDEVDVQLAALASKRVGPAALHGNMSYTFVGGNASMSTSDVLGLSVALDVETPREHLDAVGELIWEQARVPGADDRLELVGGAVYRLNPRLTVDASLGIGFASGAPPYAGAADTTLSVGLTWDMGRL